MVTIRCLTYNHEKYIADAIESFLMQKVSFKYEIIIHDDASTDRTAEIIKEYEMKYPDIIKPIYQKVNQYSMGIKVSSFVRDKVRGKYIAVCEGDDYWIDPYKLQKQFEFMEEHLECSLCVHGGNVVSYNEKKVLYQNNAASNNRFFTVEEIIKGGGGLFLTNSMFYRSELDKQRPNFLLNSPVGDYPLTINLALQGKVYYITDIMAAYRTGDNNSWTAREASNKVKKIKHFDKINEMLEEINCYTNYKYSEAIRYTKNLNHFGILIEQRLFKEIKLGEMKEFYENLSVKNKISIYINQYFPVIFKILKLIQRKLT